VPDLSQGVSRCAFLLFMSCQLILSSAFVSRGVHLKQEPPSTGTFMTKSKYAIFDALNPFFEIVQEGLTGLVDGKHFFDTIADDAFFDFRYNFPGWPLTIRGRADLMDQFSGYGNTIKLHSADGLVVHRSQDSRIVILEYDVRFWRKQRRACGKRAPFPIKEPERPSCQISLSHPDDL
jgi:hypothetical protein